MPGGPQRPPFNREALIHKNWLKRGIVLWSLLAWSGLCFSQNTSGLGRFSSDKVLGCAPLTINISELDNFGNISRQYIYEAGGAATNSTTHTFTIPGVYQVVQFIQNEIPRTDTLTINVFVPDPPEVIVANCRSFSASIKAPSGPYDFYRVYYTDVDSIDVMAGDYATPFDYGVAGNYTARRVKGFYNGGNEACGETTVSINTLIEPSEPFINSIETFADNTMLLSATLSAGIGYILQVSEDNGITYAEIPLVFQGMQILLDQLDPSANDYCFRLAAFDPCNNEYYFSNEVCQVGLTASFEQYRNNLQWNTTGPAATSWQVLRNNAPIVQSTDLAAFNYPDSSLTCNTDYCYRLRVNYGAAFALSPEICGVSFETQNIAPVTSIYSSYVGNDLLMRWEPGQQLLQPEYTIVYSSDGSNFSNYDSFTDGSNEQVITNRSFSENSFYYSVLTGDECGNTSPLALVTRPIFLRAASEAKNSYELTWNQYEPLTDGVRQYYIELWDAEMNELASLQVWDPSFFDLRLSSEYSGAAWVTARAEGLGIDASFVSRSNRLPIEFASDLFIPGAFTPDGNGLNEEMLVLGPEVSGFIFRVFNRWGELVFSTTDQTLGWNGYFKGEKAPQGTYLYFVEGTDTSGNLIKKSGNFVLLRK